MVLIIDGEIVADNDPRAIAKRKGVQPPQPPLPPPASTNTGVRGSAGRGVGTNEGSPLDVVAGALGIQGMTLTIPRLHARVPSRDVPMIIAGILGVATLFFGWRVLALAAGLHVVSSISETSPGPRGGAPHRAADRPV